MKWTQYYNIVNKVETFKLIIKLYNIIIKILMYISTTFNLISMNQFEFNLISMNQFEINLNTKKFISNLIFIETDGSVIRIIFCKFYTPTAVTRHGCSD